MLICITFVADVKKMLAIFVLLVRNPFSCLHFTHNFFFHHRENDTKCEGKLGCLGLYCLRLSRLFPNYTYRSLDNSSYHTANKLNQLNVYFHAIHLEVF